MRRTALDISPPPVLANGEYAATVAYALTTLGKPHTVSQVDAVTGRAPSCPTTFAEIAKADRLLIRNGCQLELIAWEDTDLLDRNRAILRYCAPDVRHEIQAYKQHGRYIERTVPADDAAVLPALFAAGRQVVALANIQPYHGRSDIQEPVAIVACNTRTISFFSPDIDGGEMCTRGTELFGTELLAKSAGILAITNAE